MPDHDGAVITVLVADDQALVRTGFRMILEAEGDLQVVAEAENGVQAVRQASLLKPDVALMDIRMPELDGLAATEQIRRLPAPPTVVVLTTFGADDFVYRALIAAEMVVAETTVKTHVARMLMRLGLRGRVQAVVLAYETGFVRRSAT